MWKIISYATIVGMLDAAAVTSAYAIDEQVNKFTSYEVTLMSSPKVPSNVFGWIDLKNGSDDMGFIYLSDRPVAPRLGSSRYIVTSIALSMLPSVLDILDSSSDMQIRYFDPQTAGFLPSAFLETVSKTGVSMKLDTRGDKS